MVSYTPVILNTLYYYYYYYFQERDIELAKEAQRQEENDKLRKEFAKHANAFHQWLTETRQVNQTCFICICNEKLLSSVADIL